MTTDERNAPETQCYCFNTSIERNAKCLPFQEKLVTKSFNILKIIHLIYNM